MLNLNDGLKVNITRKDSLAYSRELIPQLLTVGNRAYCRAGMSYLAFHGHVKLLEQDSPFSFRVRPLPIVRYRHSEAPVLYGMELPI